MPKSVQAKWDRMIGDYLAARERLALVVVLVDLRRDPTELDRQMVRWLQEAGRPGAVVLTKTDRVSKSRRLHRQSLICRGLGVPREDSVLFSSPDKLGRGELWSRIDAAVKGA